MTAQVGRKTKQLKDSVLLVGAVVVGIADLTEFLFKPPTGGPLAITFGIPYPNAEVEQLPEDSDLQESLRSLAARTQEIYSLIERSISNQNQQARCCRYDAIEQVFGALKAPLGQKSAAVLAGLGWIGKSSLLCTPTHGPRVRLGTLFTDAHLKPDTPFMVNYCGECCICQDACPIGAVTSEELSYKGLVGFRIDRERCLAYICRNESLLCRKEFCGLCLKECPFGVS